MSNQPARLRLALFTGGAIGAGKSVMTDIICAALPLVSLDADHFCTLVASRRKISDPAKTRVLALRWMHRWQSRLIATQTPILVNTTATNGDYTIGLHRRYTIAGYRAAMVFVDAPADDCDARNAARRSPRPFAVLARSSELAPGNCIAYRGVFKDFRAVANRGTLDEFKQLISVEILPWVASLIETGGEGSG